MRLPLKTALVGLGRIAALYADDPVMSKRIPFTTHAQVLSAHPDFDWCAAVDPSPERRALAKNRWGVPVTGSSAGALPNRDEIDVAVLACPPHARLDILADLPRLQGVLAEKPLGTTWAESEAFVTTCERRGMLVQVNLTRRADPFMQELAHTELARRVGNVQVAYGTYGNGLLNNGTHMVDVARMLLGEVRAVQALRPEARFWEGPIPGDVNLPFALYFDGGISGFWHPLRFSHYRECSLDVWGETGRLQIVHEGLDCIEYATAPCRSLAGGIEIAADRPQLRSTGYDVALYRMYDNLAAALHRREPLVSSGSSALETARVIDAVLKSVADGGVVVGMASHAVSN